jgi:cadmium resistance protein CadD (predicted permease)
MTALITVAGMAVALFVSTNIDSLFVLLAFFSDPKYRRSHVVLGQYAGLAVVFAVSALAASFSRAIPLGYVAWLGLLPIAIGCKKIRDWRLERGTQSGPPPVALPIRGSGAITSVILVGIANGGDNIGAYVPQFAVHSGADVAVMGLVFLGMTGLWCALALAILSHPALKTPIRVYGHRVVPFILIGLGLATLYEGGIGGFVRR